MTLTHVRPESWRAAVRDGILARDGRGVSSLISCATLAELRATIGTLAVMYAEATAPDGPGACPHGHTDHEALFVPKADPAATQFETAADLLETLALNRDYASLAALVEVQVDVASEGARTEPPDGHAGVFISGLLTALVTDYARATYFNNHAHGGTR